MMAYLRDNKRIHRNNVVEPLIDGEVTFKRLLDHIRQAKSFIYIAVWNFEPGLELTRTGSYSPSVFGSGASDPVLQDELLARAKAGVEIKVLAWNHLSAVLTQSLAPLGELYRADIRQFRAKLRSACTNRKHGCDLLFDVNPHKPSGRRLATGSHHQKFWVMDVKGGDPIGFVGGLNLGQHDWDTPEHLAYDRRRTKPGFNREAIKLQQALKHPVYKYFVRGQVEKALNDKIGLDKHVESLPWPKERKEFAKRFVVDLAIEYMKAQEPFGPRHDIFSQISGPAVTEIVSEFRTRWRLATLRAMSPNRGLSATTKTPAAPLGGTTSVQLGHTAYYPKPGGKDDIIRSYLQAIRRAEHYIYLENQYFVSPQVAQAIAKRLMEKPKLEVIIVLPNKAEDFAVGPAIALQLYRLASALYAAASYGGASKERVQFLGLVRQKTGSKEFVPIYVHAKIMIVDDQFFTIGSANSSPRSFEYDTELNMFVEETLSALTFRKALWAEHLDMPPAKLERYGEAIGFIHSTSVANTQIKSGPPFGRYYPLVFRSAQARKKGGNIGVVTVPPPYLHELYSGLAKEFL